MTESLSLPQHKPSHRLKKRFVTFLGLPLIVVLAIGLVVTGFLYYKTKKELQKLSTPEGQKEVAAREIQNVVDKLGKLTLLPDENPVIATIVNSNFLATQSAFYQKAENGDKLVVYQQSQKAFIYSPAKNIIVNSGPLITDQKAPAGTQQETQRAVRVEVRNGTATVGAATKIKDQISGNDVEVVKVTDATRKDYQTTQVFSLNSAVSADQVAALATKINGQVGQTLPEGEASSSADVLIIVGQ